MVRYRIQWLFWDWVDVGRYEDHKEACRSLHDMKTMWPMHRFRMVWERVAKAA